MYIIAITYCKHLHFTQLSQTENSVISSTFRTIENLLNTIITADVNAHSPLLYSPTEDHRELIKDILLNSNHITLNTNTPTRLPSNQKQQPTLPDITTASADLHDYTSWQTIHSPTSLSLLTTLSIHHKTKTTRFHCTKTIKNYQKADWTSFKQRVENLISYRTPQHKSASLSTTVTIFANKIDQTHKSLLLTIS